jgi:hypothetical protein
MAWKGADNHIRWSRFESDAWSLPEPLTDRQSSNSPALTVVNDQLYMAWKEIDNETLLWSSFDGSAWSPPEALIDGQSSNGPALS